METIQDNKPQDEVRTANSRLAQIEAKIQKKKEQIEELRRQHKTEEAKTSARLRKERNRRLIIMGANIEKVLGFTPDMGILLGILNRGRNYFQAPLSDMAANVKREGDKIIAGFEAANKRKKANGTEQ